MTKEQAAVAEYREKFDSSVFSQRLSELLNESKTSQRDFANSLGVSPNTVSGWKVGRITPSYKRLCEIARLFQVDPEYMYIPDAPRSYSDKYNELRVAEMTEYYKPYENYLPSILKVLSALGYTVDADLDNGVYTIQDTKNRAVAYLDRLLIEKILTGIKYAVVSDMEPYPNM